MFQLLKNPNIDFMSQRRIWASLSAVMVVVALVLLFTQGVQQGIEFTGGTELQLKFAEPQNVASIRDALAGIGGGTAQVTTIGAAEENEIYIKLPAGSEEQAADPIPAAIEAVRGLVGSTPEGLIDLNVKDEDTVAEALAARGVADEEARAAAAAVLEARREGAILRAHEDLAGLDGISPAALEALREVSAFGPFALRGQSYIGPAIGHELLNKARLAIIGSLLGMLAYIWIRFQLVWGFAAVIALTHDTILTLGLFSIFGYELSLPVVAAFLTLVGYSVNDTVVVFDRIRENIESRGRRDIQRTVNRAINQTLSRTIITTGSTWLVVVALFVFGGEALKAFAFVLTAGILVGTYSSIFIASPVVVALTDRGKQVARAADSAAGNVG